MGDRVKGSSNKDLTAARKARKDEFYTTREVIEDELKWYREDFKGRPVLCNCNDWPESEFVKFFMRKMSSWNIPKLTAVGYRDTVGTLFEEGHGTKYELVNDGRPADQPYTVDDFAVTELEGDGGFDSPECEQLLDEPNVIVCTNPPFSKAKTFLPLLVSHHVGFLILGNINSVTYRDVFPLFMANECWLGVSIHSGDRPFIVPEDYPLEATGTGHDAKGRPFIRVKGVRWFTNLDGGRIGKNELNLEGNHYYGNEEQYPKYDDYDAINVSKVADIPEDYFGEMGVPITFLDKWAPNIENSTEREREREHMVLSPGNREQRPIDRGGLQDHHQRQAGLQPSHCPAFQVIGELNHGKDGPHDKATPTIDGRTIFKRLLIRRSESSAN